MTVPAESLKNASLRLQEGETLLDEGQAQKRHVHSTAVVQTLVMFALTLMVAIPVALVDGHPGALLSATIFASVFYLPAWALCHRAWSWHRWWLTDRRLIVRHGFVGHRTQTVPLNRVVDVTIKVSWLDRLFGLSHLYVRSMAGPHAAAGHPAPMTLYAVDEVEDVAHRIMERLEHKSARN